MRKLLYLLLPALLALAFAGCGGTPPEAPKGVTVTRSGETSAALSWEASEGADFYRIYRKQTQEETYRFVMDVDDCAYEDVFLEPGQSYVYKVTALSGGGESAAAVSGVLSPGETALAEEPAVLSAPVVTSVTRMDAYTNVILFEDDNEGCTYRILRSDTAEGEYVLAGTTEEKVFYDSAENGDFYYRVTACLGQTESESSAPVLTGTNAGTVAVVPVIMYHEFVTQEDLDSGVLFDEYAIYKEDFESDLRWLKENGYTTITAAELLAYLTGEGTLPDKPILLTIDDGKWGVYKNAWPLLAQYDMTASLAVIGEWVEEATQDPEYRAGPEAPFCTWEEIAEMSRSGHMEIVSHTYGLHVYSHDGRQGASTAPGESAQAYVPVAYGDYRTVCYYFEKYGLEDPQVLSYPYSVRTGASDDAWRTCGYRLFYSGNDSSVRKSSLNYFVREAGLNRQSSLLRRIVRMHGTPLSEYITGALSEHAQ